MLIFTFFNKLLCFSPFPYFGFLFFWKIFFIKPISLLLSESIMEASEGCCYLKQILQYNHHPSIDNMRNQLLWYCVFHIPKDKNIFKWGLDGKNYFENNYTHTHNDWCFCLFHDLHANMWNVLWSECKQQNAIWIQQFDSPLQPFSKCSLILTFFLYEMKFNKSKKHFIFQKWC
jgi:hypothetical protein